MEKPYGMLPGAFQSHIDSCFYAKISPNRLTQVMGNSVAVSAGTHRQDGWYLDKGGNRQPYGAAFDVRSRDLTHEQEERLLSCYYQQGIVGWHRKPIAGLWSEHIHVIYVRCKMNADKAAQVHDWFNELNGMKGHKPERHAPVTQATINRLRADFLRWNG